jgi:Flp pilus assembly protein TadD
MSLLIKALEQAAKDRDIAKGDRASPSATASSSASLEPMLEPPPPPRGARPPEAIQLAKPSVETPPPAARGTASLALDAPAAPRRTTPMSVALSHIDAEQQRARAAAVMQASAPSTHVVLAYLRGNPVIMFGTLAGLFGIGFGVYVYLQIAQPGLFVRNEATGAQQSTGQSVSAPTGPQAAPATDVGMSTGIPTASVPAMSRVDATANPVLGVGAMLPASPATGRVGTASAPTSNPAPISTASIIASADPMAAHSSLATREPQVGREDNTRREPGSSPMRSEGAKGAKGPTFGPAETTSSRREPIAVSPTTTQPRLNPALAQAYTALQTGSLDDARTLYSKLSQSEPLNVDALLGLAYIAAQQNRSEDAMALYLRILQINPRHAAAQAALIGLMGRADPVASETRLKQLIAREPSAFLHFVLGNLYADQTLWAQAQQAYFQAHTLEPNNPDYAYNLAIGLDHLRQNKLALGFYTRAEQLATSSTRANFDVAHARERINVLSSQSD